MILKIGRILCSLFLVALLLMGCDKGKERPDNDVLFWHAMGGPLGRTLQSIVDEFNRQNPDVTVRLEYMGSYSSLRQKIIASLAARNNPDLAQSFETWTSKFVESDKIVPLDDYFYSPDGLSEESIKDIYTVFREVNSYQGKLWALPFNKSVPVLYYNADIFREKGIPFPEKDWTWNDFLEKARVLTTDGDSDGNPELYGFTIRLTEWLFQCLLYQKGGLIFDGAEKRVLYAEQEGVQALQFLQDLITKEKVSYYSTGFNNQNDFAAQKVGMIEASCASRIYLSPVLRFDWRCVPLPRFDKPSVLTSGTNIVLFKSENKKRMFNAWRFIKFFVSTDITRRWSIETGYLPVRKSAVQSREMEKAIAEIPAIEASLYQLDYAAPSPKHAAWSKGRDYMFTALEETFIGSVSPEESLKQAAQKTQIILDRYND